MARSYEVPKDISDIFHDREPDECGNFTRCWPNCRKCMTVVAAVEFIEIAGESMVRFQCHGETEVWKLDKPYEGAPLAHNLYQYTFPRFRELAEEEKPFMKALGEL